MTLPPFWRLDDFGLRFDTWADEQKPDANLRKPVLDWTFTRFDDPYAGFRRMVEVGPNYWWGQVPGTIHNGSVVVCGYWVFEESRRVRCDSFATLSLPL
ncbi:MAG TPA: hypothetical protein VGX49_14755 [Jatrophihabitans sp.]|jgi:hypothetical protein|nr:hypothetical protein [Jatrophihabitans sp.]